MWNVSGQASVSQLIGYLPGGKTQSGYNQNFSFSKTSGRFNFNVGQELTNKKFNSNDLGYFTFNNFVDHFAWMGYRWTKPTNWYNNLRLNVNAYYSRRLNPGSYQSANFNINSNGQLKNLWFVGVLIGYEPESNNYYEPRVEGRVFRGWSNYFTNVWFETNNAKKYTLNTEVLYIKRNLFSSERYSISFQNRYRFNNRLTISHTLNLSPQTNNTGFAGFDGSDIIFGKRDVSTVENMLNIKYSFNDKMNINTRVRHYWSEVKYKDFYTLLENGKLAANNTYNQNRNQNLNFFNIDMVYTWQFAPGSFINVVWKNAAASFNQAIEDGYFKNFKHTMKEDDNNNLSFKVIYFLDYLQLKKKKS